MKCGTINRNRIFLGFVILFLIFILSSTNFLSSFLQNSRLSNSIGIDLMNQKECEIKIPVNREPFLFYDYECFMK